MNQQLWEEPERGNVEGAKKLLKDARVNSSYENKRRTPLSVAAEKGLVGVVEVLLEDGRFQPSSSGIHAVEIAAERGHFEVVRVLLGDTRVDPSTDNNLLLEWQLRRATWK